MSRITYEWRMVEGGGGKSRNLNIERRKEPNLSAELVRSRWKSIHVTRERKCAGKLLSGGHRRERERGRKGGPGWRDGESKKAKREREGEREREIERGMSGTERRRTESSRSD